MASFRSFEFIPRKSHKKRKAIGKAFASTAVSMTREILFGVSLPILLPVFFGLDGLLWSFPAADLLTFLIALFFIRQTFLELKK